MKIPADKFVFNAFTFDNWRKKSLKFTAKSRSTNLKSLTHLVFEID